MHKDVHCSVIYTTVNEKNLYAQEYRNGSTVNSYCAAIFMKFKII